MSRPEFCGMIATVLSLIASNIVSAAEPMNEKAAQAMAILRTHCSRCHGDGGSVEGGFNYLLDLPRLIERKRIIPGNAASSPVVKRINNNSMPPSGESPRVSADHLKLLQEWIDAGAPAPEGNAAIKPIISSAQQLAIIQRDLESIDRRSRRFQRYFSFINLANAGLADGELATYRLAFIKLLNSLSWHPSLYTPDAIDPGKLIYRIDLRRIMWDATLWNRLLNEYPYAVLDDSLTSRAVLTATASKVPVIRADWFIATASRPPLYQDLLQLPSALSELERQLRVDAGLDIIQERISRVAFNGSGISRNNRILERHDSVHGYYWRTYDFEEVPQNLSDRGVLAPDRRNVFAYPLGPGGLESNFLHAGGEAIFALPNGLQGYFIMNAANNRLDKAPVAIVSDPRRPDRAVELGVSCMGCHVSGILPKVDQMHEHLGKNPKLLPRLDQELALALYPAKEKSMAQMEADSRRYLDALAKLGSKPSKFEPIVTMTLRYEADLDRHQAAADLGLSPNELSQRLKSSEAMSRSLGSLLVDGGTISRQVWVAGFADVVKELGLGTLIQAGANGGSLPDNTGDLDPLETLGGAANHAAFTKDGRRAIVACPDRSVKVVEVESRRNQASLVGHTASVWSVAITPTGSIALSGGMDGTVRVWDLSNNRQRHKLEGHTALVATVAISDDGTLGISGGLDGSLILWNLNEGKELRRFDDKGKFISASKFAADGKTFWAGIDQDIVYLNLEGKELSRGKGHSGAITALSLSADSSRLASASDDGTIRTWDASKLTTINEYKGHTREVKAVDISADGKWLLSGSADRTVRLWNAETGKTVSTFRKHADAPVQVAFVPGNSQTVSIARDGIPLIWGIEKFVAIAIPDPPTNEAKSFELKPKMAITIAGTLGPILVPAEANRLLVYDQGNNRLLLLDMEKGKILEDYAMPPHSLAPRLSADGKKVVVVGAGVRRNTTTLIELQTATFKPIRMLASLQLLPIDMIVSSDDTVDMLSENEIVSVDLNTGTMKRSQIRWPDPIPIDNPLAGFTHLKLLADGWLVSSDQVKKNWIVPFKSDETVRSLMPVESDLIGSEWLIGAGEKWAISRLGSRVSLGKERKSWPFAPYLAATHGVEGNSLWLITPGGWLEQYQLPDWSKPIGRWKLPVLAYQMAYDPKSKLLLLGVIDPKSILNNPRANGAGDVWLIDPATLPR